VGYRGESGEPGDTGGQGEPGDAGHFSMEIKGEKGFKGPVGDQGEVHCILRNEHFNERFAVGADQVVVTFIHVSYLAVSNP
jgi:hypothetical protein